MTDHYMDSADERLRDLFMSGTKKEMLRALANVMMEYSESIRDMNIMEAIFIEKMGKEKYAEATKQYIQYKLYPNSIPNLDIKLKVLTLLNKESEFFEKWSRILGEYDGPTERNFTLVKREEEGDKEK